MMNCNGIQFGLACFIMVAFTGLAGFMIVYHYATFERPMQQFAIVTDAGSTQTRSSLFTVNLDLSNLNRWINTPEIADNSEPNKLAQRMPLAKLFQVRQVSTCQNGGPVAALQSESNATKLTLNCLRKFSQHIKRLDFLTTGNDDSFLEENDKNVDDDDDDDDDDNDSEEISEMMAKANHRVNSVTHFYLGATAGMRALSQLNATRAQEKINWMEKALNESNRILKKGPYINKAFIDIIDGSEEAAFGWLSVNFVCDKLEAKHVDLPHYSLIGGDSLQQVVPPPLPEQQVATKKPDSVGTLELGGASAQMAYQVPENTGEQQVRNSSLELKRLELFKSKYHLATRSDLCLGMSQAVLRTNYVLLRRSFSYYAEQEPGTTIELPNACMQNKSSVTLSGQQLVDTLKAPCLAPNELDTIEQTFRDFIATTKEVRFTGLGNTTECNYLLSNLVEPSLCKKYFSLCPESKNRQPSPDGMPFVTISGYNKALLVLDLNKQAPSQSNQLEQVIANRLGGYSIDQLEYLNKMRQFCSLDVAQFPTKYPKMNKAFYGINCLQLVYINKLLTEFYLFDNVASWKQIKFLLFPVAPKQSQTSVKAASDTKNDIGWTLGLLLNATSQQLVDDPTGEQLIYYHHGASLVFIIRTTLFLMLACTLLALGFIGMAILAVQRRRRSGQAYLNRSYQDSI